MKEGLSRIGLVVVAGAAAFLGSLESGPVHAQEMNHMQDYEQILEPVFAYVDGAHRKDRALLERAYDVENAQMKSLGEDGAVHIMPIRDVIENIWLKGDPVSDYYVKVLNLRRVDETLATVEIENNGVFVDQLTLFLVDGEWRIIDKVFSRL